MIKSWLSDRTAHVAFGGKLSKDINIHNMVYQGTVLSPPLWNIVYADAAIEMNMVRFLEIIFADNVNCIKNFGIYIYIYIYTKPNAASRDASMP